jgi:hypothetical protein
MASWKHSYVSEVAALRERWPSYGHDRTILSYTPATLPFTNNSERRQVRVDPIVAVAQFYGCISTVIIISLSSCFTTVAVKHKTSDDFPVGESRINPSLHQQ